VTQWVTLTEFLLRLCMVLLFTRPVYELAVWTPTKAPGHLTTRAEIGWSTAYCPGRSVQTHTTHIRQALVSCRLTKPRLERSPPDAGAPPPVRNLNWDLITGPPPSPPTLMSFKLHCFLNATNGHRLERILLNPLKACTLIIWIQIISWLANGQAERTLWAFYH